MDFPLLPRETKRSPQLRPGLCPRGRRRGQSHGRSTTVADGHHARTIQHPEGLQWKRGACSLRAKCVQRLCSCAADVGQTSAGSFKLCRAPRLRQEAGCKASDPRHGRSILERSQLPGVDKPHRQNGSSFCGRHCNWALSTQLPAPS